MVQDVNTSPLFRFPFLRLVFTFAFIWRSFFSVIIKLWTMLLRRQSNETSKLVKLNFLANLVKSVFYFTSHWLTSADIIFNHLIGFTRTSKVIIDNCIFLCKNCSICRSRKIVKKILNQAVQDLYWV